MQAVADLPWGQYSTAVLLALVVHGLAGLALLSNWQAPAPPREFLDSRIVVRANLVQLQPQAAPAVATPAPAVVAPAPTPAPASRQPGAAVSKPAPAEPEPREQPSAPEPVAAEPEPAASGPTANQQALAREGFLSALAQEAQLLSEQADNAEAASHAAAISRRIGQFWSRPPSARNGMEAELVIELVPTGEVVSVSVARGSGNAAFDRSAELAVRRAAEFDVPADPALFERYFRRFRLLFRPEDLMR